jgi:tetratricopeptide (TPR) repeat protein
MDRDLIGRRAVWAALCLAVALVYSGVLDAPFVYDDKVEVAGNRALRLFAHLDGDALSLLLAGRGDVGGLDDVIDGWRGILSYNTARPLLITSYAIDFQRGGLDPRPYHITNLLVHGAAVGAALALVHALAGLARRPLPTAALGGLVGLWALHPMATEAVAYTTGRSEALCGAFSFMALAAWAGALQAEREGRSGLWGRGLGTLCFALAVGSKEPGVMVFPVMLWMELLFREGRPVRAWSYLPHLAAALGAVALRLSATGALLPVEVPRPLGVQLTTSAEVLLRYLQLWALPVGQTLFHDQPDVDPASVRGIGAWAGLLLLLAAGAWAGRRRPLVAWGLGAALLFLLPSTSVVMLKEHMAEHRAYVTGLYLLVAAWGLLPEARAQRLRGLLVAVLVVLSAATWGRNRVWASEALLWREATAARPGSDEAWYGLGDALRFAKDCTGAVPAYEKTLELNPGYLDAYTNLGICKAQLGDAAAARAAWRRALQERPSYCKAHANLGSLAYQLQEWEEAEVELRSALAYCPENAVAHWLLGNLYYGPRRDRERALRHYEELVRLHPQFDHTPKAKERILELTW